MGITHPASRQRIGNTPYRMHWGDVFFPGAQSIVFDWQTPLPPQVIEGGPVTGTICGMITRPFQRPQLYLNGNAYLTAGIGGVAAGQLFLQPLSVPPGQ